MLVQSCINAFEIQQNKINTQQQTAVNKGAQGIIYKVKLNDGREIAMKSCRFINEQEKLVLCVISQSNLKNVVQILGLKDNKIWMELCERDSYKMQFLNLDNAIYQITKGIKELHSLDIVHRDLKPENVLYRRGLFKICDFGISHIGRSTNRKIGTGNYMPPELFSLTETSTSFGTEVDIWAFAALIYEISEFKVLFAGSKDPCIISQLEEYIQNPDKIYKKIDNSKVPNFLKGIVKRMLSVNPVDRPKIEEILYVFDNRTLFEAK